MAEFTAGSIAVAFKAQTAELIKGVEDVNKRLEGFKQGVEALGAFEAFEKIADVVMDCVKASSEAELNVRKLQAVVSSQSDVGKFKELAEQLSHVSTFSDDASMSALALLGKFNLTDQQMASMLPKIADFAAFMGVDLPQAAEIAGKAVANGSGGLRGLGLSFTQAEKQAFDFASQQERVTILMDKMNAKFAGVAEAAAGTGAGAMKQFHNASEELAETLGRLVDSPVAAFFNGLTSVVGGITEMIEGLNANTKTVITVVGGLGATLVTLTIGTLAVQKAFAFFGGLPAILTAVGTAFTTMATTIATVVFPLTVIAGTVMMIEGMISRIKSGNYNSNEGIVEGIKNNIKQSMQDMKDGFKDMFLEPKAEAGNMTEAMKGFDNTLGNVSQKLIKLDFSKELSQATEKDSMANLSRSLGMDFSQHYNQDTGDLLEGPALDAAKESEAKNAADAVAGLNGDLSSQKGAEIGGGMSQAAISARATELKDSVSGMDLAMAGFKGGLQQLAGKFGATGTAIAGVVSKFASGDIMGGAVSLGIEMLSRTKSFGKLMESVNKIFSALSQVLEPLVAAVVPFLDVVSELLPVFVQLEPGLKILGVVVKGVGEGLQAFVKTISGFWNSLLENLASGLSHIPFVGDDIADWLRGAKIKIDNSQLVTGAADGAVKALSTAAAGAAKTVKELDQQTSNIPAGFKIEAARYNAIGAGASSVIASAVSSPVAAATLSHPGGGYTPPTKNSFAAAAGAAAAPGTNVTVQNVTVISNDPQQMIKAVTAAAAQAAFVASGKKSDANISTRQYWGK